VAVKNKDEFGPSGKTITDYSIVYDVLNASFGKVVFLKSPKMEQEFDESYARKFPSNIEISYILQDVKIIPRDLLYLTSVLNHGELCMLAI
jgi:hypothetical protein